MANSQSTIDDSNQIRDSLAREQALSAAQQRIPNQNNTTQASPWINDVAFWNSSAPRITKTNASNKITPEAEAEIAGQMSDNKQRQLAQIAKQEAQLERDLSELEGNLNRFKNGKSLKLLGLFRSPIDLAINTIIEEAKKPLKNLDDKAKAKKLEALAAMIGSLMVALKGFKVLTAALDAVLLYRFSVIRVIVLTLPLVIVPIILLILSPIYLVFLIPLLWIGKFPLLKGPMTNQVTELLETLRRQEYAWKHDLGTLKKKLDIRKQLTNLEKARSQIQSGF